MIGIGVNSHRNGPPSRSTETGKNCASFSRRLGILASFLSSLKLPSPNTLTHFFSGNLAGAPECRAMRSCFDVAFCFAVLTVGRAGLWTGRRIFRIAETFLCLKFVDFYLLLIMLVLTAFLIWERYFNAAAG